MKTENQDTSRRDALVEAAYRVLAAKGFEGLRLREVAAKAGIDHSTLHHHFRTKSDLIAAVLDYATGQFRVPAENDAAPTSLHEHLSFLARMIVEKPELHVVLREFDLHAIRDARVRVMIAEREDGWRKRLAERIQEAADDGDWPTQFDPVQGAELVIAVVKGASFNPRCAKAVLQMFEQVLDRRHARGDKKKGRR